jgi:uncharacterized protein involved in exopolysaccharide biosynthesis
MRYLRTFLRRWYLYVIPILILPVVSTLYGYKTLRAYKCTANLWVEKPVYLSAQDLGWNPYDSPAGNEATSMSELLQSETFVAGVAAQTGLANTLDLTTRAGKDAAFAHISGEVVMYPSSTHILVLNVTDRDPTLALQITQGLMQGFTGEYQSHRLQLDQGAITFYSQQLTAAQGAVAQDNAKITQYLDAHPGVPLTTTADPYLAQLEQQLSQDQQQVNSLTQQIAGLRQDMQATNTAAPDLFRVLDAPQLPTSPTVSKKTLVETYTGYGLGAALALVGVIVLALTQLDRKIYSSAEVRAIGDDLELELPAVETVPLLSGAGGGSRRLNGADEAMYLLIRTVLPRLSSHQVRRELPGATSIPAVSVVGMMDEEDEQ